MLYLNLISPGQKKELKWRYYYEKVRDLSGILIILVALVGGSMLMAKLMLLYNYNEAIGKNNMIKNVTEKTEFDINKVNQRMEDITGIQKNFIPWTYFLEEVANNTNKNISFSLIRIEKGNQIIYLKGSAKDRETLLEIREKFEKSSLFSRIKFPLENILQKKNIQFEIKAKLDLSNI